MQSTFMHKLILSIFAGFAAACLIQFYKVFVKGADEAVNKGYNNRVGISTSR